MTTAREQEPPMSLTASDIIELAQQNRLHPYILSQSSHKTLISHLKTLNPSSLISQYTISLLTLISLSPHTPSFPSLLSSLLSTYTHLFLSSQIPPDRDSHKTFQFFTTLLGFVPVADIHLVLDSILSQLGNFVNLEDTQVLDFLPGCLGLVFSEDGREKVNLVLDRIIESDWSKEVVIKMVSLVWEFIGLLDKERRRDFLEKVFKGMRTVLDLQDLPSVVYQLLVLGSKGFDKKGLIEGIVRFFGSDDELFGEGKKRVGSSFVRQVEGTVLLHVNFVVKQDPSLAQEVLGLVKSDLGALNHFTFTILLSVASVNRFKENAMAVLKNAVITAYRDYNVAKDCKWLPDDLKKEYLQNVQAVEKAVLRAVNESHYGREHILPTIIHFSFALLESSLEGKIGELHSGLLGVEELGIQILKALFEIHDMARTEIIDRCKFRIISQKPDHSLKVIRLLGRLIQKYPHAMLEHVSRLKELLDYFAFMHGKVASYLVDSVVPLTRLSCDLRDYMILVVRKAMFRQEDSVRLAATSSILDLIMAEKLTRRDGSSTFQDSSSQASCSQQAEVPCVTSKGLFQELSGLLQRCLYQQAKVKEIVYYGLVKLVLADPASGGAVLDFLLPHFLGIFEENTDIQRQISQSVKQESGRVIIAEPLDCLLSCVSWILLLQPHREDDRPDLSRACFGFSLSQENEPGGNKSRDSFSKVFSRIRWLLRKGKLEGTLNQAFDAGSTLLGEEKRKCCAFLLLGIVEVLLNLVTAELEQATDARKLNLENELLEFIDLHESLYKDTYAKQGIGTKRGNSRTGAVEVHASTGLGNGKLTQERTSFLTTSSIHQLIQTTLKLYDIEVSKTWSYSQNHSQSTSGKPTQCIGIISFAMNTILHHLKSYSTWGKEDLLKAFIWDIKLIGPPLIKFILLFKPVLKLTADEKKMEKIGRKDFDERMEHLHLALLCLKELMKTSLQSSWLTDVLNNLLSPLTLESAEITEDAEGTNIDDQSANKQLFIANFLKPLFTELLAHSRFRKIEILSDIIIMLGEKLPEKWRNYNSAFSILMCKTHATTDSKIARTVTALSFRLSSPPDDLILAEDMAKELQKFMLPKKEQTVEASELFAIMNKSTSSTICSCILQHIEAVIADMDWAVKKLKSFSLVAQRTSHLSQKEEHASVLAFENNLYLIAEAVVKALSSFFSMTLKDAQAEHLLRFTAKFYKHLAQMAKFRIAPKGCRQPLPSLTFQRLVELTCKQLTTPLYNFIAKVQQAQQENANDKGILNIIKRENKCIPDLIFHIEDYEKYLIQLTKLTKLNLLRHAKRSTARDFRIFNKEDAPNNEPGNIHTSAAENGLHEGSRENEDSESENVLSPLSNSPLVAEESESEDENGGADPISKRVKKGKVVLESDDD